MDIFKGDISPHHFLNLSGKKWEVDWIIPALQILWRLWWFQREMIMFGDESVKVFIYGPIEMGSNFPSRIFPSFFREINAAQGCHYGRNR